MAAERDPESRAHEARGALKRLDREAGGVFSSALSRAGDHLTAKDTDPADAAELWGRRVGRVASLIGFVVLCYLFGHQLGWW